MSVTTTVLRTETRLFAREPLALFWIVLFPTALLCILGAIPGFREPQAALGGLRVVDLYVGVAVLLTMIMAGLQTMPPTLITYREQKILRRLQATPIRPATLLFAQVAVQAAVVLAASALLVLVGRVVFGTPLPEAPVAYVLAVLLALVASFSMGAVITAVSPNNRVGTVVGMLFFFPSMFTAGVWTPVQAMGGLLRDIVVLTPLGAASEALNAAQLGRFPSAADLLVVAAWTVVLAAISVRTFRWE